MVWHLLLLAQAVVVQNEHSLAPVDAFQVRWPASESATYYRGVQGTPQVARATAMYVLQKSATGTRQESPNDSWYKLTVYT